MCSHIALPCRYVGKFSHTTDFKAVWFCGGFTRADLERAVIEYRQKAGDAAKGRSVISPKKWWDLVGTYHDKFIFPLDLHTAQMVRLMLENLLQYRSPVT